MRIILSILMLVVVSFFVSAQENNSVFNYDSKQNRNTKLQRKVSLQKLTRKNAVTVTTCLYDSTTSYQADSAGNWNPNLHRIYTYNNFDKPITYLSKSWNGNSWDNYTLTDYTYDINNYPDWEISFLWNGISWDSIERIKYYYDSNGNLLSKSIEENQGAGWDSLELDQSTFDANNNKLTDYFRINPGVGMDNFSFINYYYDVNNLQIASSSQSWDGANWVPNSLDSIWRDSNNNTDTIILWLWNQAQYSYHSLTSFTYNSSNLVTNRNIKTWIGTSWIDFRTDTFDYDAFDNHIRSVGYTWNSIQWDLAALEENSYCNNNCLEFILDYDIQTGVAVKSDSTTTYCSFHTGIIDSPENTELKIYPNPVAASGILNIHIPEKNSTVTLINSLGEVVKEWKRIDEDIFTIKLELDPGIYFLKLTTGNSTTLTTKLLLVNF